MSSLAEAQHNVDLIFNGTTTNIVGNLVIGATGTNNSLQILNAGSVTNSLEGHIGAGVNAHYNYAIITNANSVWYNS